jgi:hypothetical protein
MGITTNVAFDTPGNFTYDSTKVEFSGGVVRLKSVKPTASTFYANFNVGVDALYGDGSLVGTLSGATVSGGKLVATGNTVKYASWLGLLNASTANQIGCIRVKYTPNYTGIPGSGNDHALFVVQENTATAANEIQVTHLNTGAVYVGLRNSASIYVYHNPPPGAPSTWSPVSGTEYEFELNYDCTAGVARLFINGTKFGNDITFTPYTRTANTITEITLGTNNSHGYNANGSFEDFEIFSAMQHTSNFTSEVPRAPSYVYPVTNPSVELSATVAMDGLLDFEATVVATGSDAVKFALVVDGAYKYWTGAAWAASDGSYSQANTAADILANVASLDLSAGVTFSFIAFLHSEYGASRPSLSAVSFESDFFETAPAAPNTCYVFARIEDMQGGNVTSATLIVTLATSFKHGDVLVAAGVKEFAFNSDGYVDAYLIESETVSKKYGFAIEYVEDGETKTTTFKDAVVPDDESANLFDITRVVS